MCFPPCRTLHAACSHSQVHQHHHIYNHNHHHNHLLLQAHPDACSIWSVDVHGGEHVARDAVHRPPCPNVHAHQVNLKKSSDSDDILLFPTGTSLIMPTYAMFLSTRYQKKPFICICQRQSGLAPMSLFCRCTCSLGSRRPP